MTLPDGRASTFPLDAFAQTCLLEGVDQLGYLLKQRRRDRSITSDVTVMGADAMQADIVVLPGDGIGPEVTAAAVEVLRAVGAALRPRVPTSRRQLIGGAAIDATGEPLPADTLAAAQRADAVLLGAVGGPKWSDPKATVRPEQGLLAIRKALGLYANLRPVKPHAAALGASPIKPHLLPGVDLIVVRELTGGIYFGEKQRDGRLSASDLCDYSVAEIERVVRRACTLARAAQRRG